MSEVSTQEVKFVMPPQPRKGGYSKLMVQAFLPYSSVLKTNFSIDLNKKKYSA
jgi:hypothetical protein